ncbi:MAG: hypothetical protein PHR83_17985 [Paludibacter sp.]|nr:hypothetical protein [Paludibacter sp.]
MKLNFIITKLQASIEGMQENFLKNYSVLADDTRVWCMIDLVNSSNYRLLNGPKLGYVRGETFFTLIKNVISANNQVRLIKEMGDAVLLAADSLRPLIESVILINQISLNLKLTQPKEVFPFEIRCGFSYGVTKKLIRANEDFLGSSIDQLARIMSVRSATSNIYIQEEAYNHFEEILKEYKSFLTASEPNKLLPKDTKNMIQDIIYRELFVDWESLLKFDDHFVNWRG